MQPLFFFCARAKNLTLASFKARSHCRKKRLLTSSCPSVRTYQRDSHWTDFREIWYWRYDLVQLLAQLHICARSWNKSHLYIPHSTEDVNASWYWGLLRKIYQETPNLVKIWQKYGELYIKTQVYCIYGDTKSPEKRSVRLKWHQAVTMAEGVKRRRHNVTLFVNYLSAVEVSVLLVCGAPSLCDRWPTFRTTRKIEPPRCLETSGTNQPVTRRHTPE